MTTQNSKVELGIWGFAFGYFAAYAPYSALTKYLSKTKGVAGFELLPITAIASLVGMLVFLSAMRWWRYAGRRRLFGVEVPFPGRWTFLSGLCTATIIPTTTLAYTFSGISIVFMMLLMRGGVLIIAPLVDLLSRRKVRWFSWVALALSIAALLVAFAGDKASTTLTLIAAVDLTAYLLAYFIRLRFMSRLAKSDDVNARTRYFVEEQMVATPVLVVVLGAVAIAAKAGFFDGEAAVSTLRGFDSFFAHGATVVMVALVVGVLSQGTGVFGGLILLDKRENTFCVPVNRASSVLAGLVATYSLALFLDQKGAPLNELLGASLIIVAIVVLSLAPLVQKRRAAALAAAGAATDVAASAATGEASGAGTGSAATTTEGETSPSARHARG